VSPYGELVELPDSAHYIPFDRPDAIADAVLAILGDEHRNTGKPATH
jgi:pimeloyl-ACP methyl ester carboxylesterase